MMKASSLANASRLIYEIDRAQNRLDRLTTAYISPPSKGDDPITYLTINSLGPTSDNFGFLMTEPIYLAIKEQMEAEINGKKEELKELGVLYDCT